MRWLAEVRWNAFTFSRGDRVAERYLVEKPLGHGGRGEVYAVRDQLLGQSVGLKTLECTRCDYQDAILGLLAEVRLGRRVAHPNVCRIYDMGVHTQARKQLHFATMQLVPGRNLEHVLRDQRLSVAPAIQIARQVLLGLQAMHGADVLHRDVKSANIMLAVSKGMARAVLINFGRSQCLRDPSVKSGALTSGSSAYAAPEQLSGARLCPRADLFSVGVVLYEMLTGRRPFATAGNSGSLDALKRSGLIAPPSRCCDGVGPELDALLLRCLDPNPERRHADAGALLSALDSLPA
jgi:serine/threonine-protein kinase